jgi:hypothetical protein
MSLIHYAECDGTRHVVEGIKFVLGVLVEGEDEPSGEFDQHGSIRLLKL